MQNSLGERENLKILLQDIFNPAMVIMLVKVYNFLSTFMWLQTYANSELELNCKIMDNNS